MAINDDEVTVDDCPPELIKTLMPARPSQKNPLRKPVSKVVEKVPEPTAPTPHPSHLYPPVTPLPYYPYAHPYPPPTYRHYQELSPPSPPRRKVELPASSPVRFEVDPNADKLT